VGAPSSLSGFGGKSGGPSRLRASKVEALAATTRTGLKTRHYKAAGVPIGMRDGGVSHCQIARGLVFEVV